MFNGFDRISSKTIHESIYGKELRIQIALAKVNAHNNSEDLLSKIMKIVYSLYQSKKIIKKVYNNIIKSIQYKMDIIFMKSKNSKTSRSHVLILNLLIK